MRVAQRLSMPRWVAAASAAAFVFCTMSSLAIANSKASSGLLVTFDAAGRRFDARVDDASAIRYVLRYVAGHSARQPITVTLSNGRRIRLDARIVSAQDCRSGQCITLKGLYAGRSPY